MEYIFILGRAHNLCLVELEAVFKRKKINYQPLFTSNEVFHLKVDKELNVCYLMNLLGGTVKIAEVKDNLTKPFKKEELSKKIVALIREEKNDFGLSFYNKEFSFNDLIHQSKEIKRILKSKGLKVNYVLPHEGLSLSSVVVFKKKLTEINIVKEEEKFVLAKTLVVQDFESWNKRDYQRPFVDPSKGMLPPKVARMMVNLGRQKTEDRRQNFIICDPFCGMGTILAEAMMVGCDVVGSDIDPESEQKAKKNLEWLIKKFQIPNSKFQIFVSDATHVSEKLPKESIDAVVTEPYLGPLIETKDLELRTNPTSSRQGGASLGAGNKKPITKSGQSITEEYLKNIITGLEKLYIGCLKDWWKILRKNGRVVIVLPSFNISACPSEVPTESGRRGVNPRPVKKPIDICEKLGYNVIGGPYQYSRPQAVVVRNIYILQKSSNFRNSKS